MKNQNNFVLIYILISLMLLFPAFGEKKVKRDIVAETELVTIDILIDQTDYNNALHELDKYIQTHPDYFDEAQKRVEKILLARRLYADKAEELVLVIQNDPGNNERILEIIRELEALEKNPTATQLAFVRDARRAATFNLFRRQFVEINNQADQYYAQGNYVAAVDTYHSGFHMYRDDFFFDYNGREEATIAAEALAKIEDSLPRYRALQDSLNSAISAYIDAANQRNSVVATASYVQVEQAVSDLVEVRNSIFEGSTQLSKLYDRLTENTDDVTDASFLPFVVRYASGRQNVENSGIFGVIDGQLERQINNLKNATSSAVTALNDNFVVNARNSFVAASSNGIPIVSSARDFGLLGSNINNFYSLIKTEGGTKEGSYPSYSSSMRFESEIASRTIDALSVANTLRVENERMVNFAKPENSYAAERLGGTTYVQNIIAAVKNLESVAVEVDGKYNGEDWAVSYRNNLQNAGNESALSLASFESTYNSGVEEINSFVRVNGGTLWQQAGKYYEECADVYVSEAERKYSEAENLYTGVPFGEDNILTARYPQEALNMATALSAQIDSDREILVRGRNTISVSAYSTVPPIVASINNYISRLDALKSNIATLSTNSRNLIARSQEARQLAEQRARQAEAALDSGEYDLALQRLQEARVGFSNALSYQESAELRTYSDNLLSALGERILRAENEIIVMEVRRLKTEARNEYHNGNFEAAESLLTRAAERWAITNVDEDIEISNLLALVTTALSVSSGRVISFTSPLYPEMSQTLSIARTHFDEGQRLLKAGNRTAARTELELALAKIQELQLVYPLNQEASLLSLRISQTLDPDGFATLFENRVNAARNSYRNPAQQREAYTALLDLHEINPNYPGLAQLIYDVEIAIGVRQRPIDRTALNRSTELTNQAQRAVNAAGRDEIQLRRALALIDEAMGLNPNNDAAMILRDRIQISLGGGAAVVLSAEDEAKYQQAIQAMQRNNIVTANAIVEQLLQNPANRRSSKILDLQRQIRALL